MTDQTPSVTSQPEQGNPPPPSTGGRGSNLSRGNGGRGRGSRGGAPATVPNSFTGSVSKMNGYIFTLNVSSNPKHDYNRTLQELRGYAAQECDSPDLLKSLFKNDPTRPTATEPPRPTGDDLEDEIKRLYYVEDYKEFRKQQVAIRNGEIKIYECIIGQCTEELKAKLKGLDEFEEKDEEKDCAWLLKSIKKLHYKYEEKKDPFMNLRDAKAELYTRYQRPNEDLSKFYNEFKNRVEVVEHQGGSFGEDRGLISYLAAEAGEEDLAIKFKDNITLTKREQEQFENYANEAKERYLACTFLKVVSRVKYYKLLEDLQNQVTWGQDVMPKTLASAYDMVLNYKNDKPRGGEQGAAFAQVETTPGADRIVHPNVSCHRCRKRGHYASQCPEGEQQVSGVSFLSVADSVTSPEDQLYGICCSQMDQVSVGDSVLLDSQSTHSIFKDRTKLTNIHHCGHRGLTMRSSGGGIMHTVWIGTYEPLNLPV